MKFHLDVDCTPEEARAFLGLPDVSAMQERLLQNLEQRLVEALDDTDPKTLIDKWMPMGMKIVEQWPTVWAQMAAAAAGMSRKPDNSPTGGSSGNKDKE